MRLTYSPITPKAINWIPPINIVLIIIDVHPVTARSNITIETKAKIIIKNAINDTKNPTSETTFNGKVENDVIASKAKASILEIE